MVTLLYKTKLEVLPFSYKNEPIGLEYVLSYWYHCGWFDHAVFVGTVNRNIAKEMI